MELLRNNVFNEVMMYPYTFQIYFLTLSYPTEKKKNFLKIGVRYMKRINFVEIVICVLHSQVSYLFSHSVTRWQNTRTLITKIGINRLPAALLVVDSICMIISRISLSQVLIRLMLTAFLGCWELAVLEIGR